MGPARAAVLGDVLIAHGRERDGPGPPVVGGREVLGRDGREGERGLAVGKEREKAREGKKTDESLVALARRFELKTRKNALDALSSREREPTISLFSLFNPKLLLPRLSDAHEGLVVRVGRDERRELGGLRAR